MKKLYLSVLLFLWGGMLWPQSSFEIEEITEEYDFPEVVKVFKATRESPNTELFYLKLDINQDSIVLRPYLSSSKLLPAFVSEVGAIAAINGGYFSGGTSLSSVITPGQQVEAQNVTAVSRSGQSFPVIRSMLAVDEDFTPSIEWVYHFGSAFDGIRVFDAPLRYDFQASSPLLAPTANEGEPFPNLLMGLGGAPVLIKNGQINITYNEEIMWGSGVGLDNEDPRTAFGYTADNQVILLTADGRQNQSAGISLPDLADFMFNELACVEAINLDGGGSTQMATSEGYINSPSEQRTVPTILAITTVDRLGLPEEPEALFFNDTEDETTSIIGDGWSETANPGFWGDSPALINEPGDGSELVRYQLDIDQAGFYELSAWWVASGNRAADTPFLIHHLGGTDTIRVDQRDNGSSWQKLGNYFLEPGEQARIEITNGAIQGSFVVADGIRTLSFDLNFSIESLEPVDQSLTISSLEGATIDLSSGGNTFDLGHITARALEDSDHGDIQISGSTLFYLPNPNTDTTEEIDFELCYGSEFLFCGRATLFLSISTSEEEEEEEDTVLFTHLYKEKIKLYPNPSAGRINISGLQQGDEYEFEVFNLSGSRLLHKRIISEQGTQELDLSQDKGLYIIQISNQKETIRNKLWLK
ncbi:MAG: phosphodiester glycosidase family protein [Cyclobacteriaceae bacterium]|nr:phosphodiester glycosidase family protein [Cyclobacteriaceae bacterium]MCH8516339.1 phosphodiester glycosidase family protein [Cyclobacteriaceae bacterium]